MKTKQECNYLMSTIRWSDSSLERVVVDYDSVTIELKESTGRVAQVRFLGHISLHWRGHWDENIVEKYSIDSDTKSINNALQAVVKNYEDNPPDGGGTRSFKGPWYSFLVELIDSETIEVIAQDVEVEF